MIQVKTFYFNELRVCTYIVWDESKQCVIVDAGCNSVSERDRLEKFIETNSLKPVKLINTHGHFDHIMGSAFVVKRWQTPFYIHKEDKELLTKSVTYCNMFGYSLDPPPTETLDLEDGALIDFGNSYLSVIYTPGHSRGGVCFYNRESKIVFTGDSLFAGSIGRTDLPGGNYDHLMESLLNKLIPIGEDYRVYPGHGPETTIGNELNTNPFLRYE